MPSNKIIVRESDLKEPRLVVAHFNRLYEQAYNLLGQLAALGQSIKGMGAGTGGNIGGLTSNERRLLDALARGSTESLVPATKPVLPTYTALPPTSTATTGEMINIGGVVYLFNGSSWISITAAASPHNILSATHSDTLAAAVVRGDLLVGNATPAWARFARGAALLHLRMNAGGTDPEWAAIADGELSANVALYNAAAPSFANTLHFPSSIEDGPSGSTLVEGFNSSEITLSLAGATTDSATNLLPADARIRFVAWRITQTISGGGVTTLQIGDATTANRFDSTGTLVAGTTGIGLRHMQGGVATDAAGPVQAAAAKVRTTMDGTPLQGKVRVVIYYEQGTAPTS